LCCYGVWCTVNKDIQNKVVTAVDHDIFSNSTNRTVHARQSDKRGLKQNSVQNPEQHIVVRYAMYSRRIWLLKLIFLLLWIQYGSDFQKMKGFKFSHPSPFLGGHFRFGLPGTDYCTYFRHFLTNFSNERVVLWVLKCHEFIYATFKSTRSVPNRLPVHRVASKRGMSFVST